MLQELIFRELKQDNDSPIKKCHSCGYTYSKGRGLCADWFCSERCLEWFNKGNPLYGSASTGKGPYRIVAGPPDLKIGSVYSNDNRKPSPNITLEQLATCLDIPTKAIKKGGIQGKHGRVIVRSDGRNFWLDLQCSTRQLSAYKTKLRFMYNDDDKNKFFMYRLPSLKESKAIRDAIGLKKRPTLTPENLARLKNNLPTPLETPSSCGKTPIKRGYPWYSAKTPF